MAILCLELLFKKILIKTLRLLELEPPCVMRFDKERKYDISPDYVFRTILWCRLLFTIRVIDTGNTIQNVVT